jgi:hypothetical protein
MIIVSYFELPLSALSLVFPNDTKISLSGLVAKYQMDGSTLQIEGREGISVNGFPLVKLGDMSLCVSTWSQVNLTY